MSSNKPAALPAASNIVSLKTLADHDRDVLTLILERLTATSAAAITQLNNRPKPFALPERKRLQFIGVNERESIAWEIVLECDFLGALAQKLKKARSTRVKKGG
jgi:hypothetical protein